LWPHFLYGGLLFKKIVPKIKFSERISRINTTENNSGLKYRFKFENSGRRNVIDLEVIERQKIRGLRESFKANWTVVYLPTSALDYKKVAIIRPVRKTKSRHILEIKANECDFFQNELFPEQIRLKSTEKTLTLDDVMNLGAETEFQIMIIGTDEYSGAKKFFESKTIN